LNKKKLFLFFICEKFFFPALIVAGFLKSFASKEVNDPTLILSVLKITLVLFCIYFSNTPKQFTTYKRDYFLTLLTFIIPFLFKEQINVSFTNSIILGAVTFAIIFYYFLLFISYLSLGENFSVLPAYKQISNRGAYTLLRHPIYSSYIHISAIIVILSGHIFNLLLFLIFFLLIYLRSLREEKILILGDKSYLSKFDKKNRFFSVWITLPLILLGIVTVFTPTKNQISDSSSVKVQLGFPVLALDPKIYDDWSSVFIGNHIYYRFFSEKNRQWDYAIARDFVISCLDRKTNQDIESCDQIQVKFNLNPFSDCNDNVLSKDILAREFNEILKEKTWVLPNFRACYETGYDLCYQGKSVKDIQRRLGNLYFRFGWSLNGKGKKIGSGPYCLEVKEKNEKSIFSGRLVPKSGLDLPVIEFFTSGQSGEKYNFALYGHSKLQTDHYMMIPAQTPLAYYMVTNKKWASYNVPWNEKAFKDDLRKYLMEENLIYDDYSSEKLINFVSSGSAAVKPNKKPFKSDQFAVISLPDYLPGCKNSANFLKKGLEKKYKKIIVQCENTSKLIDEKLRLKQGSWDVFLSPLSPGAPGRESIQYQYFSSDSKESWTEKYKEPTELYYLAGIGQSWVVIDRVKICGLNPNPLGQGDILVTDMKMCD